MTLNFLVNMVVLVYNTVLKMGFKNLNFYAFTMHSCTYLFPIANLTQTANYLVNDWCILVISVYLLFWNNFLYIPQSWMWRALWRNQEPDGFVPMRFMPYFVITSISPSMSSQWIYPKVVLLYYLTARCLGTFEKMGIIGKRKKMGKLLKKLTST